MPEEPKIPGKYQKSRKKPMMSEKRGEPKEPKTPKTKETWNAKKAKNSENA